MIRLLLLLSIFGRTAESQTEKLPEAPKPQPNRLRDIASRVALELDTRKTAPKVGRVFGGGVVVDVDPRVVLSGGYEGSGWYARAFVRPFVKKP